LLIAGMMSRVVVRCGRRVEIEERRRTDVFHAIRFLAKPGRRNSAVVRRAKLLVAAWRATSIIEMIFDEHRLGDESEFIASLEGAAFDRDRLTRIAAAVDEVAVTRRGPKIAAASAAHEFLINECGRPDKLIPDPE
jgi:hypothetical protein